MLATEEPLGGQPGACGECVEEGKCGFALDRTAQVTMAVPTAMTPRMRGQCESGVRADADAALWFAPVEPPDDGNADEDAFITRRHVEPN